MPNNLSGYDANQVLSSVYDINTNCLRVCVVEGSTGSGSGFEVIITHLDDSIRLGDGTNFLTSTSENGDIALDVHISNSSLDIRDLSATQDNIAISDGVETVAVNTSNELQVRDDDANTSLTGILADTSNIDVLLSTRASETTLSSIASDTSNLDVTLSTRASESTLATINSKLVDGTDIGDVTVNNLVTNPVETILGNGTTNIETTNIGLETILHVKQAEGETYYIRIDRPDPSTTFIGKTYDLDAATSDAVWQISRTIVAGTETITQFADDQDTYNKVWNDRVSLFGAVPFANGLSIQFDGANDFIDVTHNTVIDFDLRSEAASWNFWVKTSETSAAKTFLEKYGAGAGPGWRINLAGNDLTVDFRGSGGGGDRLRVRTVPGNNEGDNILDGSWHMITITYDGSGNASGVNMYLDAVPLTLDSPQNDALVGDTSTTANAAIASRTGSGDNFGPGNIDEVSIWDVELSATNVTTIYNSGVPINLQGQGVSPISASLVAWWRMGDGPNDIFPTIEDVESNIIGTMTNMTAGDIEGAVPG